LEIENKSLNILLGMRRLFHSKIERILKKQVEEIEQMDDNLRRILLNVTDQEIDDGWNALLQRKGRNNTQSTNAKT